MCAPDPLRKRDMELKRILEAALFVAGRPMSLIELQALFAEDEAPDLADVRAALAELAADFQTRPIELKEVASGFRFQVREGFSPWLSRLFEERPGRYSKAFLETLAIVAYRQPVTRGEIEEIRGVAVTTQIIRALEEREWVRAVGHKETPGRPALYATTRQFLDYFNLKGLDRLPPLQTFIDRFAVHESHLSVPNDHEKTEKSAKPELRRHEETALPG
jgi:segregation and condensation protein B